MKGLKIGFVVIAFALAVAITLMRSDGDETLPDTDDSKTLWKCTACEHQFEMTAREVAHAKEKAKGDAVHCPKCQQVKAYQLMACYTCQTLFFGTEVPGSTGECPKCRPDAEPWIEPEPIPVDEDDPYEPEQRRKRERPKSV